MASYHDFDALQNALGFDLMVVLLGVSRNKLFEYDADFNSMPRDIMARLDFIIELVGYLIGAYNDEGVQNWFFRQRAQLDNKAPVQIFCCRDGWRPEDPWPQKVLELAQAINNQSS